LAVTDDDRTARSGDAPFLDLSRILTSIGEVPYQWDIGSDALAWGGNVCSVLGIKDPGSIGSGRLYARLLDSANTEQRFDAVMRSKEIDLGKGVAYSVEYCLLVGGQGGNRIWVEDTGRWFAGPDGRPAQAHGVVRIINETSAASIRIGWRICRVSTD
jgi:hypothetical protein